MRLGDPLRACDQLGREVPGADDGRLQLFAGEGLELEVRALAPDRIVGLDAIMAEAVATKFMPAPLSKEQIAELVRTQLPP